MHELAYPEFPDSPETEVVLRWLECEEGMQDLVTDLVEETIAQLGERADRDRILDAVAGALRAFVRSRNPLMDEVSLYSQLIDVALDRVRWRAIAEWLVPDDAADG